MKAFVTFGFMLIVFVSFFSLVSCASMPETAPSGSSLKDINTWIYYNISYVPTTKSLDTAQTPAETLAKGSGCCIDMCLLFVDLAEKADWIGSELYPVEYVKNGTTVYHMIVDTPYGFYDPTNGAVYARLPSGWRETSW